MDGLEMDSILAAKLMSEAAEAMSDVAMEMASLYDGWVARGDCPHAVAWARTVLERLGWWAGRLDAAADPDLVAKFPSLD